MGFKLSRILATACIAAVFSSCGTGDTTGRGGRSPLQEAYRTVGGVSPDRLAAHVGHLASDELEGRAPGSKGEEATLRYLIEQYRAMGLKPGNPNGTYLQEVPLVESTVMNRPPLKTASARDSCDFRYREDFMGWTLRKEKRVSVEDAELVFVGYGIVAPEYQWDDYKGADVTGKVIVMLVGDPPLPDTTLFGGRAMTYYGRWTYKFETAAEKGAAGAIIIHNPDAAGYPWEVVVNSWSGKQFDIHRAARGAGRCAFESWLTEPAAERLFAMGGRRLDDAYRGAVSTDFTPVPLGVRASISIENNLRDVKSHNVVALIEGKDPVRRDEYMMYTAHWDHLGCGNPVDGDSIYNGALDNATGVAGVLEIARAFAKHGERLERSVLFINTAAEESGLIGAYHYAANPLYPLSKTVAMINIDALNIWGRTRDVVVVGFGFSELDGYLERVLEHQQRAIKPDAEPEKGYYYRSDHFPFAKKGVPALYADGGVDFPGRAPEWGMRVKQEYTRERYHKPQDEYEASWDFSGAVEDLEALFRVGLMIATTADLPQWSDTSEFKQIREESLKGSR